MRLIMTFVGEVGNVCQYRIEEPADPDAFTFAVRADAVHAVVPVADAHQRQTMRAKAGERAVDGARAVLVDRGLFARRLRLQVHFVLVRLERRRFDELDRLVEQRAIARGRHVVVRDEWQPQVIVRELRAHAGAPGRVPPMLSVALDELVRGRTQNLLARQVRRRPQEREHVLQLVAIAVCAARLVERRAAPQAAGQYLIEQPLVEQHVHALVGRLHLHRREHIRPETRGLVEGDARLRGVTVFAGERAGLVAILSLAQHEHDLALAGRRQLDGDVQRRAGVHVRAEVLGQATAFKGRRVVQRAVAADELGAVGGGADRRLARRRKRDALGEVRVVPVARVQRGRFQFEIGDNELLALLALDAQYPFAEIECAEFARLIRFVAQAQPQQLDRLVARHIDQ